jgi:hypothetical protein
VKGTPLLAVPFTVATTGPVVAPEGPARRWSYCPSSWASRPFPLKVSVLAPCVAPKLVPDTVTLQFTGADVGLRFAMFGGGGSGAMTRES